MRSSTNIYVMKCREFYKIGIAGSTEKRRYGISSSVPFEVEILFNYKPKINHLKKYERERAIRRIEKFIHNHFKEKRVKGEWFLLLEEDLKKIPQLIENGLSKVDTLKEILVEIKK